MRTYAPRTVMLAAAFFALGATATVSATAAPQDAAGRVDVVGTQPKQARLAPFMFDNVQGQYGLDDGRVLTVTGRVAGSARTLYADLGDGPTEIVHVGKNRFVAVGKELRLSFQTPDGRRMPDTVHVTSAAGHQALAQR